MKILIILLILFLIIYGCSKRTSVPTQEFEPSPADTSIQEDSLATQGFIVTFDSISISDSLLLLKEYSSVKYPNGFYHEDLNGETITYEHLLFTDSTYPYSHHSIQLSTNSESQALAWSESTEVHSSTYIKIDSISETEKYFQFTRALILQRVNKLSYVDRSMYDYFNKTPLIAKINARPIDSTLIRNFVEYLWFVENYKTDGAVALGAINRQSDDTTWCVLYTVGRVGGDWREHDQVTLYRSQYAVSNQQGNVIFTQSPLRTILGKIN